MLGSSIVDDVQTVTRRRWSRRTLGGGLELLRGRGDPRIDAAREYLNHDHWQEIERLIEHKIAEADESRLNW